MFDSWESQGVFLLNSALTVEKGKPNSHTELWLPFTKKVVSLILDSKELTIFLLWGKKAKDLVISAIEENKLIDNKQKENKLINNNLEINELRCINSNEFLYKTNKYLLTSAHPSPYSADKGFFGNNHFIRCNEILSNANMTPIKW